MASKKSFAEWSEDKQRKDNKTVNGKTFAQWTRDNAREAAVEDYVATTIPRSAEYLDVTNKLMQLAMETVQPRYTDPLTEMAREEAATAQKRYGRGNIDLYDRPVYINPDGSYSTVRSISVGFDDDTVLLPTVGWDQNRNPVSWTNEEAIQHYLQTGENLGKFKTEEEADAYAEWLHNQQAERYGNTQSAGKANANSRGGISAVTPGIPGGGGRGSYVPDDFRGAKSWADYVIDAAKGQKNAYADMVTPDNSPLEVQRRETNRAFRTANAFMPLEAGADYDEYLKQYDIAAEEEAQLHALGGRSARETPETIAESAGAGVVGALRGLVNYPGYLIQEIAKGQIAAGADKLRGLGYDAQAKAYEDDLADLNERGMQPWADPAFDAAQKAWTFLSSDVRNLGDAMENVPQSTWSDMAKDLIVRAGEHQAQQGKVGRALAQTAQGVTGMIPSILSNLILPGSGLPVMFVQAAGNATEEAINNGARDENAFVYGTAVGAVEVLTEKMFGGIPGLGVGALDDAVENAIKRGVGNEAAQRALLFLVDALGEGVEEFTSEFGDYFLDKWLLKNDDRTIDEVGKDAMYSFLIGALTSIAMQAPVEVANMAKTSQGRKQLAQIVADQVDQQMTAEQTVAPRAEAQTTRQAEPAQQPITQKLLRSIAEDPEQLAALGIDTKGKSNSQIREEIRAKLLADRAAQEQVQRASALAQEMRRNPSELGWYGMPSDDPVAAPNWYNQQNVAETDEDGVPAAPAAPWYNTPQFDNYGNSEWYEGRAATQPVVEPLMQLAQEMATEQITAARDAELRAQEAAKAQAAMASQNAQTMRTTIPAQQTTPAAEIQPQQTAPAAQEPAAPVAGQMMTPASETPAQAQKKPTVRAVNPGLDMADANTAKAKLTRRESRALDALGKVLGKKIQFVDTITAAVTDENGNVRHSGANAEIDGDTIRIALDSDDPFLVAAVHEVVHGIRDLDEASYQRLAKFVANNMTDDHREVAEWEEAHKGYSAEDIPEEIVCDAFGRMLGDEAKLQQFVQDDRNAAQKIFDALHDLLVKVQRALSGGGQKLTDNQRAVYSDLEGRIETMLSLFEEALNDVSGAERETSSATVTKDANHKYSRSGRDVLDEYVEQYGEIKRGEKPARDITFPKRTTDKTKVSMTARTVAEAGATPESFVPTIENLAANHEFDYTPYSDEAAISNAAQIAARKGWSRTLTDWSKEVSDGGVSKTNTAVGWALYNNAVNSGDTETALNVLNLIVKHQRNAAQAVQATRILKQLNPETQLYNAENVVADINEDLKKRLGKNAPEVKIDPDLAEQFLRAKNQEDRDKVMTRIFRNIGRQMPTTFLDRWTAWRYTAMLGNARTIGRNIAGNLGFAPVVLAKDLTATALEGIVSKATGGKIERTKGNVIGRSDLLSAAWDDYANMQEAAMGQSKYSDRQAANKEIEDARRIFGNTKSEVWNKTGGKVLEGWRKGTNFLMDKTDVIFNKPQYVLAMAQYCAANGISAEQIRSGKGLEKARAYAVREAQKATYRDTNDFSQMVSSLGKSWLHSENAWKRGIATLGEGVLPFRKTPANILARGVEYSPIGLIKSLTYDAVQVKNGNMSAADMIDDISAGLTGSGLLALGVYLAAQGLLRGRGRGDDKKKEFADLEGHQGYALEIGGNSYTLDWLAPEALPLFIGANLWEAAADRKDGMQMKDILTAVSNVSEPMLQMSMLQSLNDLLDGNTYGNEETSALMRKLSSAATSYLTQAFPTLLGQVERTGENKRMTTYTDKNGFLTSDMQYILGKISAKIPGWDFQQIPYIDAWGREELTGKFLERAGQNFVNPSYVSKVNESDMEKELERLYDSTGESVFPTRAAKYFNVDGERKDLSAKEYVTYATEKGRTSYTVVGGMVESDLYKGLNDDEKATCVKEAYTYANQTARTAAGGKITESWVEKAQAGVSRGIKPETYILVKNAVSDVEALKDKNGNSISNSKGLQIMQTIYSIPGLNYSQRKYLFECFGVGKTVIGYNKALVDQKLAEMRKK